MNLPSTTEIQEQETPSSPKDGEVTPRLSAPATGDPVAGVPVASTNFFSQISHYLGNTDITIAIRKIGEEGQLAVSVLPKPKVDDQVKDRLAPILLKAGAAALDEGFFAQLDKPLRTTDEFSVELSAWEVAHKKAEQESQKAKKEREEADKKAKAEKEAETKRQKKADTHLARAEELLSSKQYADAVAEGEKATKAAPGYAKAEKRLRELREETKVRQQANLFETPSAPTVEAATVEAATVEAATVEAATTEPPAVVPGNDATSATQDAAPKAIPADTENPLKTPTSYFK